LRTDKDQGGWAATSCIDQLIWTFVTMFHLIYNLFVLAQITHATNLINN